METGICDVCKRQSYRLRKTTYIQGPPPSGGQKMLCGYCTRYSNIYQNYGLTREQYDALFTLQNGCCAICKKPDAEGEPSAENKGGRLNVDHCHTTNAVRGLLCTHCNTVVARLGDSEQFLDAVTRYLRDNCKVVYTDK